MIYGILLIISFILMVIGLFFILLYVNLLVMGYSFFEFVYFIIRSIYPLLFLGGLLLMIFILYKVRKGKRNNGLLL